MAIGKNKRLSKGKKGGKKKIIDPLSRKEWFDFKAPPPFESRSFGKTLITKTQGTSKYRNFFFKISCHFSQESPLRE